MTHARRALRRVSVRVTTVPETNCTWVLGSRLVKNRSLKTAVLEERRSGRKGLAEEHATLALQTSCFTCFSIVFQLFKIANFGEGMLFENTCSSRTAFSKNRALGGPHAPRRLGSDTGHGGPPRLRKIRQALWGQVQL